MKSCYSPSCDLEFSSNLEMMRLTRVLRAVPLSPVTSLLPQRGAMAVFGTPLSRMLSGAAPTPMVEEVEEKLETVEVMSLPTHA